MFDDYCVSSIHHGVSSMKYCVCSMNHGVFSMNHCVFSMNDCVFATNHNALSRIMVAWGGGGVLANNPRLKDD